MIEQYDETVTNRRLRLRRGGEYTAIVIVGFVALLVVFSRRYLEPYDSALGQVVLVFVGFYWAAGFWWMQRMGRGTPVERFLATSPDVEGVR